MPITRRLTALLPLVAATAASAADLAAVQFHGFASQGYMRTHGDKYEVSGLYGRDTKRGTFEFNEFGLNAIASPVDRLRVGIQLSSYDLGKYGNNQMQLDWAFGEYQIPIPWEDLRLSVAAGRFKTGHAFYNDYRDLDMTRTAVFLPSSTYSASFRDFFLATNGAQLNGSLDIHAAGSLDFSGFIGTQNLSEKEGPMYDIFASGVDRDISLAFLGLPNEALKLRLNKFDSLTLQRMSGGNLTWNTPVEGLRLKGSSLYANQFKARGNLTASMPFNAALGPASYTSTQTTVDIDVRHWFDITAGAEYQMGDLTLASEFTSQYYYASSTIGSMAFPVVTLPATTVDFANRTVGGYLSANYQLSMLPGAWSRLSVYGAGSIQRSTDPMNDTSSYDRTGAVALRYDVADHFLVKGQFDRIQDTDTDGDATYGNLFSLKTTYDF